MAVAVFAMAGCQAETFYEREERRAAERAVQERVREELASPAEDEFPYPAPPALADRSRGKTMVRLSALSSLVVDYEVTIPGVGTTSGTSTGDVELIEDTRSGTVIASVSGRQVGGSHVRCQIIVDGFVLAEAGGKHDATCRARAERS